MNIYICQNEWWDGPPMLTPRKSHCSGVHSGYLYAAGGTDVQKPVTAAERIRLEGLNRETKVLEWALWLFLLVFFVLLFIFMLFEHEKKWDFLSCSLLFSLVVLNDC